MAIGLASGTSARQKIIYLPVVIGLLWSGGTFLLLLVSLWLKPASARLIPATLDDLAAVLFGASSLALIIFSILVGAVAVYGWQSLKTDVQREIEARTQDRIARLEKELVGRVTSVIGFMIGALHSDPGKLDQTDHRDYLSESVFHCQKGYDILKDLESPGKNMALNNLVYFSCLYGQDAKRDYLLTQARKLKEIGQERNAPHLLLTYCRAVLQYGSRDDLVDALRISEALRGEHLTDLQKKEATFYVTSLAERIANETVARMS